MVISCDLCNYIPHYYYYYGIATGALHTANQCIPCPESNWLVKLIRFIDIRFRQSFLLCATVGQRGHTTQSESKFLCNCRPIRTTMGLCDYWPRYCERQRNGGRRRILEGMPIILKLLTGHLQIQRPIGGLCWPISLRWTNRINCNWYSRVFECVVHVF